MPAAEHPRRSHATAPRETSHALYLPPATHRRAASSANRAASSANRAASSANRAAEFVESVAPALTRQLGVVVEVYALRPKDAAHPRVVTAFRRRGIDKLPALLADGRAYIGCRAIEEFYDSQLRRAGGGSRGQGSDKHGRGHGYDAARGGAHASDADGELDSDELESARVSEELDDFMRSEMGGGSWGGGIDLGESGYRDD